MYNPYLIPVSIKGIVFEDSKVWLRYNERNEWELPGGKLDEGEQPEQTIVRELQEELGFDTEVITIVHSYLYTIHLSSDESKGVLVVTYLCKLLRKNGMFELKGEAGPSMFQTFTLDEIRALAMPQFYKDAISKAAQMDTS
jgi:mutator protein MutT